MSQPTPGAKHTTGAPAVAPVRTYEDEKTPLGWPMVDPSPMPTGAGGLATPSSVRAKATPGQSPQATSNTRMQSPGFLPNNTIQSGRSPQPKRSTPASPNQVYTGRQSGAQKKEAVFRALASGGVSGSRRAIGSPNVLATPNSIPGSPMYLPGIGLTNATPSTMTVEERIAQDIAQAQGRHNPNGVHPLQGLRTPGSQRAGSQYSSHLPSQVASALHSHRSTNSQQAYAAKKLAMEQEHAAQLEALRLKQEKEQSSRYAEEQAALLASHQRAMAEAEALRQAEEDEHKFLNSYENFPPSSVYDTPFSQEEEQALLTFLQHSDNTLLSEPMKRTLTSSQLRQMYERPNEVGGGHYSLELLLVHLQHLNLTGVEYPSLKAVGEAIEHAENHSTAHGAGAPAPLLPGQTKGPAHHSGAYSIRRKIWLYLKRKEVTIYPGITWTEVEQLFILTLAGPRLGSILYRLDQIGIHFPTFHSLLTHVSEIYARKASQHTKNCQTLLQFLYDHQEVVYWEPRTDAEEVRPRVKSLPLFLSPLQPTLGLTKRLMELGLGMTTMVYLTECFLQSRYQFDTEEKYVEELQRAFGFLRACVRKAHSFFQSEPSIATWAKKSKDVSAAASGACILALGPPPAPSKKRGSSAASATPLPRSASFLTKVTLAEVERLIKESGLLNYTPASEAGVAGGETNDTGDDQVLNVLVSLNTQVDLQIKSPYTTFEQIVTDVRAERATRWDAASGNGGGASSMGAGMLFSPDGSFPMDDSAQDFADAMKSEEAEKRRALRAKKKGRMVAQILASLREYLLSAEATVLRRKKEGLLITDEELQSLLANGGGSLESVKGHCRQLVDQGIYAATIAELQESVSYSHQLSLEQQKEHRRILYDALRSAGLLDPAAFPFTAGPTKQDRPFQRHYQSDVSPRVDDALNALLFFNAQGQHPTPKQQVYLTNYFYSPFQTLSTLIFLISIAEEQNSGSTTLKTAADKFHMALLSRKPDEEEEDDEEESEDRKQARLELQVRNLSLLLHTFHGLYTAYLHAKKQVHDYLRSEKCELKVMGVASTENDEVVNLLPNCTITDVESLFASSSVGLKILPYLMELSYTPESALTSKSSSKDFQRRMG